MPRKPKKRIKDTCLRCGADRKESRRLNDMECSAWGKGYARHLWGVFTGKTYKYEPKT